MDLHLPRTIQHKMTVASHSIIICTAMFYFVTTTCDELEFGYRLYLLSANYLVVGVDPSRKALSF